MLGPIWDEIQDMPVGAIYGAEEFYLREVDEDEAIIMRDIVDIATNMSGRVMVKRADGTIYYMHYAENLIFTIESGTSVSMVYLANRTSSSVHEDDAACFGGLN